MANRFYVLKGIIRKSVARLFYFVCQIHDG
jgi:hypothetical protein